MLPEIRAWYEAYLETLPAPHACPYKGRFDELILHWTVCENPLWGYEARKIMDQIKVEQTMHLPKSGFSVSQLVDKRVNWLGL